MTLSSKAEDSTDGQESHITESEQETNAKEDATKMNPEYIDEFDISDSSEDAEKATIHQDELLLIVQSVIPLHREPCMPEDLQPFETEQTVHNIPISKGMGWATAYLS